MSEDLTQVIPKECKPEANGEITGILLENALKANSALFNASELLFRCDLDGESEYWIKELYKIRCQIAEFEHKLHVMRGWRK